jgi:hypothetical protein
MKIFHRLPIFALVATVGLLASHAHAIEGGFVAETCAWPETVRVFSGWGAVPIDDGQNRITCTGIYIGGRTVLTATACVQQLPGPHEIQFGDLLGASPRATNSLHAAIPIEACQPHPNLPVAACRLKQTPDIQAIPIMHECEAPSFLAVGNSAWVVGTDGSKRWATAQLLDDLPVEPGEFELPQDFAWTTSQGLDSEILEDADLGAPLFVRGTDGSLRVAAVAVGIEPAQWIGTWLLIDWLVGLDEQDAILPCHSVGGAWDPSPACASLVGDRTQAGGDWARGPRTCESQAQVVPVPTCGP